MVFKKLFGNRVKEEKPAPLTASESQAILSTIGIRAIPSMPAAAQRAFELSTNPNAEARDFVEVIESDESMSARVLRVANSVFFDRGKPSKTIEEAVLVIGINEIRSLLSANSLSEIFPSRHPARTQLWRNDLACAIFSKMLAERSMPSKADSAFLAGLMHDIGKLLLLQRLQDGYQKVLVNAGVKGNFIEPEEEEYPFNHTQAGQLIGEKWNFSKEILFAIRYHHSPWNEIKGSLAGLVRAADTIAHALAIGHPKGYGKYQELAKDSVIEALEQNQIHEANLKDFLERAEKSYYLELDRYNV